MSETFDLIQTDAATGTTGAKLGGDVFTQGGNSVTVVATYLCYGPAGGPYERVDTTTGLPIQGTVNANIVSGQTGVTAGAGAVGASTPRFTLASDDPAVASLGVMDDWDETNRCAVNLIASQVAITGGAGAVAANTPRVTLASDDPAVASLSVMDDWDETNRCAVNLISGQVGVAAGSGAAGATTQRVVCATDDPGVVSLAIIDDWDESDRCKVNIIAGQTAVAAGSGAVSANTQRVVLATDDPAVALLTTIDADTSGIITSVQLIDDAIYADGATWNDGSSKGILASGVYQAVPQTIVSGTIGPLQVTANGYLIVSLAGGTGTQEVVGDAAHDAAASGNPVLMGGYASAAAPTDVSADADAVRAWFLRSGAQVIQPTYAGILAVAGNGAVTTGVQRVTIASDSTGILAGVTTVTTLTGGGVAHDGAAGSVKPHLIGGFASAAAPSDVSADADAVQAWFLRNGAQIIQQTYAGVLAVAGAGAVGTGVQRVTLASDSPGMIADDAAFTPGTTAVRMVGFTADETATDSVDEGDGGAARMTLDRKQIVTNQPHTQGGLSIARTLDLDETAGGFSIKASAGQLYGWAIYNNNAATRYVKLYDASSVTVGAGTPKMTIPIPAGALSNISLDYGIAFATKIIAVGTTGVGDSDTGAPSANDLVCDFFYF